MDLFVAVLFIVAVVPFNLNFHTAHVAVLLNQYRLYASKGFVWFCYYLLNPWTKIIKKEGCFTVWFDWCEQNMWVCVCDFEMCRSKQTKTLIFSWDKRSKWLKEISVGFATCYWSTTGAILLNANLYLLQLLLQHVISFRFSLFENKYRSSMLV